MLQNTFVSNTYLPPDLVLIIHVVGISIAISVPFIILAFSVNYLKDWLTNAFSRRSLRMSLWDLFVTIVVILCMALKQRLPFQRRKRSYNSSYYSSYYSSYTCSVRTATGTDAMSERPPPPTTQLWWRAQTRKICGALSWWGGRTTAPSTDVEAAQANVTNGSDEKTEERPDRPEDIAEKRIAQARAADDGDIVEVVSVSEGSSRSPRGSRRRPDRS